MSFTWSVTCPAGQRSAGGGVQHKDGSQTSDPTEEERSQEHWRRQTTGTCLPIYLSVDLPVKPVCLHCLFTCLSTYLSRQYWRMDLLKGKELTVKCQPMSCSAPLSGTALICCYGNTVCPLPPTRTRWPAMMSTASVSTEAGSLQLAKVTNTCTTSHSHL